MAEEKHAAPTIIDIDTPEVIAGLKYGEILTDQSAAVRHRLLAANELAELIVSSHVRQRYGFATLPTAIAAATGQIPMQDVYAPLPRETYTGYNNRIRRLEHWTSALNYAKNLSTSVGKPFYDSGDYLDIGLVLPMQGVAPSTVIAELRKVTTNHEPYFKTDIVLMGLKRMPRWSDVPAHTPTHYSAMPYNRCVEFRPYGALGDASETGYRDFDFGADAIGVALGGNYSGRVKELAAQVNAVTNLDDIDLYNYGAPELVKRHLNGLSWLQSLHFPNGAQLHSILDPIGPMVVRNH